MAKALYSKFNKTGKVGRRPSPWVARECVEMAVKCLEAVNNSNTKARLHALAGDTKLSDDSLALKARLHARYKIPEPSTVNRNPHGKVDRETIDKYLLPILEYILKWPGQELRSDWFTNRAKLRNVLHALWHGNLIEPTNWYVAGKRYSNSKKPIEARKFVPCAALFKASVLSDGFVSSGQAYRLGKSMRRIARRSSAVKLNEKSGVVIPAIVMDALKASRTGLYLDRDEVQRLMRKEKITWKQVRGTFDCTSAELSPALWKQGRRGDIYSRGPNVQGLRKALRPALRSMDGPMVFDVDFNSFFPRLAFCLSKDTKTASGDNCTYYDVIASSLDISRSRAKLLGNSFLNGRTSRTATYLPSADKGRTATIWPKVEDAIRENFPEFYAFVIGCGRITLELYTLAASVFMACYAKGLEITGGQTGIPLHDGWIVAATPAQADEIKQAWERIARELTGAEIPVKCRPV
jgi:hypothetical protein